jgi:uncharacterized repeat protein (TIGR02543 family)
MNLRLCRKAYMFEFIDKNGKNEYFSFAVPPESEDFDFGQRVTETKTLGGSVFDDYGNDTIGIQINGTTINEERKLIYRGQNGKFIPKYLSGEKEIFELQKLISDWGKGDKIPGKKIYLYDLSKMSLLQLAGGNGGTPSRNYWRVVIKKFKIKRSKDKPNTYHYTLDMIGMEDTEHNLPSLFGEGITNVLDKCQKVLETIEMVCSVTEAIGDALDTATSAITATKKAFNTIKNLGNDPKKIALFIADKAIDAPMRLLTGGSSASIYNATRATIASVNKVAALVTGEENGTQSSGSTSRDDLFIVTFDTDGGSFIKAEKVIYGRPVKRPADPVLENNAFRGWFSDPGFTAEYDFDTEVTKSITLYAKWEQTAAIITFNSRQGSAVAPISVAIGETATPPTPPTRNGYAFEYWCTDPAAQNEFNFGNAITADMTLYARWKTVYTILFVSNGGSAVKSQTIDIGGKVIYPPIPNRENYLFGIWCTDPQLAVEYDFNSPVSGSFSLYAKWTRVSNNVTFNSNSGSEMPEQTVAIGGYAVNPGSPTREGYNFIRWCSDPELTQEFLFTTVSINYPTVVYAAWAVKTLTIEFDSEGGSFIDNQSIEYGKLAIYPITPTKEGYLFSRWVTIEEIEDEESEEARETRNEYNFSTPVVENITLYADWHEGADV